MTKALALPVSKLQQMSTKSVFFIVLSVLVLVFGSYVFLVNKTIMNVVAREHTEKTISSLGATIGGLEFKYITLKNNVTIDLAHAEGYQDVNNPTFIARSDAHNSLSINAR